MISKSLAGIGSIFCLSLAVPVQAGPLLSTDDHVLSRIDIEPRYDQTIDKPNEVRVSGAVTEKLPVAVGDRVTWIAPAIALDKDSKPDELTPWVGTKKSVVINEGAISRLETDIRRVICPQLFKFTSVVGIRYADAQKKPASFIGNAIQATLKNARDMKAARPPTEIALSLSWMPPGADPKSILPGATGWGISCVNKTE